MRRKVQLDRIAQQHLQLFGKGRAHDTLCDLASHARVQLDSDQLLCLFENANTDVACTGTDFEDGVGGFQEGFVDDGVGDTRVLEDMLADIGVEFEDIVLACGGGGCGF